MLAVLKSVLSILQVVGVVWSQNNYSRRADRQLVKPANYKTSIYTVAILKSTHVVMWQHAPIVTSALLAV